MRTIPTLTLILLPWATSANAQGTFSAINNYFPIGSEQRAYVFSGFNRTPLSKSTGRIRIRHNVPDRPILTPGGRQGVPLTLDGLFFVPNLVVPGVPPGGSASLLLEVWDSPAEWPDERSSGAIEIRISNLGGGFVPPATFAVNSDFQGIWIDQWGPAATTVDLSLPMLRSDGQWVLRCTANGEVSAELHTSTDLVHWTHVNTGTLYPPVLLSFDFTISPPSNTPQYFKVVW